MDRSNRRSAWMRALCLALGAVVCLLHGSAACAEESAVRRVRVGYYTTAGFQDYDADTGIYSGYGYEFLMALQQYAPWQLEMVPCGFSEGLEMLARGELDMMNNVSRTTEREALYCFSALNAGENVAYLVMQPGDTRVAYEDLPAIGAITIGLARDSIYSQRLVNYLEENGVSPRLLWFDDHDALTAAFADGTVDASIVTSSTRQDEHIILSFSPDAYYLAAPLGQEALMREADAAITALRANDPYFELRLREKYFGRSNESYTVLTQSEKAYLAENPVARVVYQPGWYPLCYRDDQGEFAGALRGVYDLLAERTGLQFEFVADDPDKDVTDIVSGYQAQILAEQPTDFCGAGVYDVKLTRSFVSPPLVEMSRRILQAGDTLVLVEGDYLSEVTERICGEKYAYRYLESVEACVEAVRRGEADGTVLISYESEFYRQQRAYSALTYTIIDEGSYSLSIAVSNEADPRLYSILQKGLNAISEGEIANVMNNTLLALQSTDFFTLLNDHPVAILLALAIGLTVVLVLTLGAVFIHQLRKRNALINEKNQELQRANQSTTSFFSRMSHDMRTPMNGILGMARLSRGESDPAVLRTNMKRIEDSGEYLLGLINDTLDFQRIESGRLQLSPEIVSCGDLLNGVVTMIRPSVDTKHITLQLLNFDQFPDHYTRVDPVRIKQIFLNLLSNAVKFTPEGGCITMSYECLSVTDGMAHDRFVVRDNGIGMSRDFMENHMFKPFSQETNEVTGQYAGSGLGLSIVKSLVELMGGTITAESEPGVGTAFTVLLDLPQVSAEEARKAMRRDRREALRKAEGLVGRHILLAEDHPLNAEIAERMLLKAGCIVTRAADGQQCLDAFAASAPDAFDLILMDIRMPVMDGVTAARHIRELTRPDAATIPILAVTANAYAEDVKTSLDAGMNGHLSKPIDPAALYAAMTAAFSAAKLRPAPQEVAHDDR